MQKHQWRQHGIVHFKSRPIHSSSASSSSIDQGSINQSIIENSSQNHIPFPSSQASTFIVKQEENQYAHSSQEPPVISLSTKYDEEIEPATSHISRTQQPSFPFTYPEPPEAHRSSSSNGRDRSISPHSISREQYKDVGNQPLQMLQPPQAHNNGGKSTETIDSSSKTSRSESLDVCVNLSSNAMSDGSNYAKVPSFSIVPKPGSSITISPVAPEFNITKQTEKYPQSRTEGSINMTRGPNENCPILTNSTLRTTSPHFKLCSILAAWGQGSLAQLK